MADTKTLTERKKRRLTRLATAEGSLGYGEWLKDRTRKTERAVDRQRETAAAEEHRTSPHYGASGASLLGSGLADDGYAAYLRRAAKEARAERTKRLEAERADAGTEALRGYAAYLDGEREAAGERLVSTAEELVGKAHTPKEVEAAIREASSTRDGQAALTEIFRTLGAHATEDDGKEPSFRLPTETLIETFKRRGVPYAKVYEFCRLAGYNEEEAEGIASEVRASYTEATKSLHRLLGYS